MRFHKLTVRILMVFMMLGSVGLLLAGTNAPTTYNAVTDAPGPATYTITATAHDAAWNSATSAPVAITVQ